MRGRRGSHPRSINTKAAIAVVSGATAEEHVALPKCSHGSHHAPDNPAKNKETAQNIRPPRSTLLTLEHPRLPLQPLSPHRPKRLARVAHELKVSSIVLRSPASIALMSVKYRIRSASALLDSRGWPECSRGLVCLSAECAGGKPHRTTRGDDIRSEERRVG